MGVTTPVSSNLPTLWKRDGPEFRLGAIMLCAVIGLSAEALVSCQVCQLSLDAINANGTLGLT